MPGPLVAKDSLLVLGFLAIQDPSHRVGGQQRSIGTSNQQGGMEMTDGQAKRESIGTGATDGGVEAAQRVDAHKVVFLGREEGEEWFGEYEGGRSDAAARGENKVGAWGSEVGESHVTVYGGGG